MTFIVSTQHTFLHRYVCSITLFCIYLNIYFSSRPLTSTGRLLTGVARPDTQGRPGTAIDRTKTARVGTAKSSRAIRLGTAAMYSQKDGPFIQVSRYIIYAISLLQFLILFQTQSRLVISLLLRWKMGAQKILSKGPLPVTRLSAIPPTSWDIKCHHVFKGEVPKNHL